MSERYPEHLNNGKQCDRESLVGYGVYHEQMLHDRMG